VLDRNAAATDINRMGFDNENLITARRRLWEIYLSGKLNCKHGSNPYEFAPLEPLDG
jgi:hypothetical protein